MLFDLVNVGKLFKKEMVLSFPIFSTPIYLSDPLSNKYRKTVKIKKERKKERVN